MAKMQINEEDLKQKLTPEQYNILREKGTEAPFSGEYVHTKDKGKYACRVCGTQLFSSDTKFTTNLPGLAGWPSFQEALPGTVEFREDNSMGMNRTEITCVKCGSHLGHLFDDESETKTGKHFCINSACLMLKKG